MLIDGKIKPNLFGLFYAALNGLERKSFEPAVSSIGWKFVKALRQELQEKIAKGETELWRFLDDDKSWLCSYLYTSAKLPKGSNYRKTSTFPSSYSIDAVPAYDKVIRENFADANPWVFAKKRTTEEKLKANAKRRESITKLRPCLLGLYTAAQLDLPYDIFTYPLNDYGKERLDSLKKAYAEELAGGPEVYWYVPNDIDLGRQLYTDENSSLLIEM